MKQLPVIGIVLVILTSPAFPQKRGSKRVTNRGRDGNLLNTQSVVAVWADRAAYDAHEEAAATRAFRAATVMPARANLYDQRLYKVLD